LLLFSGETGSHTTVSVRVDNGASDFLQGDLPNLPPPPMPPHVLSDFVVSPPAVAEVGTPNRRGYVVLMRMMVK